jgi:hypothetical protein
MLAPRLWWSSESGKDGTGGESGGSDIGLPVYNGLMSESIPFTLKLAAGRTLHGFVDRSNHPGRRPTVVICHGFKGFMEWGFFPHLAQLLADRGLTARPPSAARRSVAIWTICSPFWRLPVGR